VRGEMLSLKEQEFVVAARSGGAAMPRVILRHVLPNALGPVIVAAAFIAPGAIISEAILGYLGIGVSPDIRLDAPLPSSWGDNDLRRVPGMAVAAMDADRTRSRGGDDHAGVYLCR
jgi:ABC-type dipeptide/oligopeptide/nickel transport system permease subunit